MCRPLSSSASSAAPTGTGAGLRTYLVEDSPIIRDNLSAMLDELVGITLVGFSGQEREGATWLLEQSGQWDLAIIDIFLQQGTGLGVLKACRQRRPEQKMVVLSSYATSAMRERCGELGADAVFDKSTGIDDLIDYCLQLRALSG